MLSRTPSPKTRLLSCIDSKELEAFSPPNEYYQLVKDEILGKIKYNKSWRSRDKKSVIGTFSDFKKFLSDSNSQLCGVRHEMGDDRLDPRWCPNQYNNFICSHSLDPDLFSGFRRRSQPTEAAPHRIHWAAVYFLVAEFLNQQGVAIPRTVVEIDASIPDLYNEMEDEAMMAYEHISSQEPFNYQKKEQLSPEVVVRQIALRKRIEEEYAKPIRVAFEKYWDEKMEPVKARAKRRTWNLLDLVSQRSE